MTNIIGYAYCFKCKRAGKGVLQTGRYGEFFLRCRKCKSQAPVFVWANKIDGTEEEMKKFKAWEKHVISELSEA